MWDVVTVLGWKQPSWAQVPCSPGSTRSSKPEPLILSFGSFFIPLMFLPTLPLLSMTGMPGSRPTPLALERQKSTLLAQLRPHKPSLVIKPWQSWSVQAQHGEVSIWHGELCRRGWNILACRNNVFYIKFMYSTLKWQQMTCNFHCSVLKSQTK